MKKFCVTDPLYILSEEVWTECCDVLNEDDDQEETSKLFTERLSTALNSITGGKSWVFETNRLDGVNCLKGKDHIITKHFTSTSGTVCILEFTNEIKEAIEKREININGNVAIFEAEGIQDVEFDTISEYLPVIYINTTDGYKFNSLEKVTDNE